MKTINSIHLAQIWIEASGDCCCLTHFHDGVTQKYRLKKAAVFLRSLTKLFPIFSPNSLLLGVLNSFLRCVRPLCQWWCPPIPAGHVAFLFICLPGLSLLVSALFRWPCSISIHLSPVCHCWCPPFSALFRWPCSISIHLSPRSVMVVSALFRWPCTAGVVRPFPLAMYFYSFVSQVCHLLVSALFRCHVAFLFICLPGLSLLVSALFRWPCSIRSVTAGVRPFPLAM